MNGHETFGELLASFYAQASPEEATEQAESDGWWRLERARAEARMGYDVPEVRE